MGGPFGLIDLPLVGNRLGKDLTKPSIRIPIGLYPVGEVLKEQGMFIDRMDPSALMPDDVLV